MAGLDDLYREIILDHYRSPRNRGELPPPALRVEGFNPLCGDEITVYAQVEDGVLRDIKLTGHGCSISQSSSSLMSTAVKGKSLEQVRETIATFKQLMTVHEKKLGDDAEDNDVDAEIRRLGELAALAGVVKFPVRIKCATLAWNTLTQALDELPA
ncbi:MAG TPA: SUF system NifU family Fe-S cluster assembly protein [Acidimicrobiales bacterium]